MPPSLHLFGIRHHGPGSARSLRDALENLNPDAILIEGPPDAADILPLAADEAMRPPVALLVYDPDRPKRSVFYPFAAFSPEWTAIRHGLVSGAAVRFIDLPVAHRFAILPQYADEKREPDDPAATSDDDDKPAPDSDSAPEPSSIPQLRRDPLHYLALAAGDTDGERWWDRMVEGRRAHGSSGGAATATTAAADATALFAAVHEAMTTLRAEVESDSAAAETSPATTTDPDAHEEKLREAFMRKSIRAAMKEGFQRIAVVCGAWHTPALTDIDNKALAADDAKLLAKRLKAKVKSTWVPWTHGRLCSASGYGAGVLSPGWYDHLWTCPDLVIERWMTRVARLLRGKDLDASSAHIIESVRLAETLATLRGRSLPGLEELNEATESILTHGNRLPLRLIHDRLIIGEVLGAVPESAPAVPLQRDLERLQTSLRLKPSAEDKQIDLDLRKETDLAKSHLLHRLNILGIPWGKLEDHMSRKAGTFHEFWRLQWQPEFAIAVIEAGIWGNTVAEASAARARDLADHAASGGGLPELTALLDDVLLAELPAAAEHLTSRIASAAAVASDVGVLMDALPALARVLRYGNVRRTDAATVATVLDGLVARICINLSPACSSLNDEAAAEMLSRLNAVHDALHTLANDTYTADWLATLRALAAHDTTHRLLAGRAWRILLDAGAVERPEAARNMSLALSRAEPPLRTAAWIEGFLAGSGLILLHDRPLWDTLDAWVTSLTTEAFDEAAPLLRRAFSTFERPERRQMGELVKRTTGTASTPSAAGAPSQSTDTDADDIDLTRAELILPTLDLILGPSGGTR